MGDFKAFYRDHGVKLWLIGIFGIIAVLTVGCLLLPELFWDKFIYRYYWGPLEVDALDSDPVTQKDGYVITQGYTLVSEITYGIVLILALFGMYRLLERLKIEIDVKFLLSVLPFFFLGGTLRVLEDAKLYDSPYVYLIISPLIYFLLGAVILGVLIFCATFGRAERFSFKTKLALGSMLFVIFDIVYVLIYAFHSNAFPYMVHPLFPIVLSPVVIVFLIFYSQRNGEFDWLLPVFLFGVFLLAISLFIILLWPNIDAWESAYLEALGRTEVSPKPMAVPLIMIITVGVTLGMYALGRSLRSRKEVMAIFTKPFNLFIIFGQMLDATATFVGVDFYGYSEKHPIPDFFFQTFGTSAVFLPIKLLLACAIIYVIDVSFKKELSNYPLLTGLIKIMIIVLGLAPGTRDMVRTAMGV